MTPKCKPKLGLWTRFTLTGLLLVLMTTGFLQTRLASEEHTDPAQLILAATGPSDGSARSTAHVCPAGRIAIDPADVGVDTAARCLPVGGDEVEGSRVDPLYSRVATEHIERIAGRTAGWAGKIRVICWDQQDWLTLSDAFSNAGLESLEYRPGWAPKERGAINLSYHVCRELDRIAYHEGGLGYLATGAAVGTLAHEATHVAGVYDEGVTDCYAMQLTAATALGLGVAPDYAALLQVKYFEFNLKHKSGTEYDSPDCYDGGPLDLNPGDSRWP